MKNLIFTLVLAMLSSVAVAQTNLSKLKRKDRDEYLERVSKEVVKELAPHKLDDCQICKISGPFMFSKKDLGPDKKFKKHYGKKYYMVKYSSEQIGYDFVTVKIWEHDGEPLDLDFDEGIGLEFVSISYKDYIKKHRKEMFQ